jgi:hypothetical protein
MPRCSRESSVWLTAKEGPAVGGSRQRGLGCAWMWAIAHANYRTRPTEQCDESLRVPRYSQALQQRGRVIRDDFDRDQIEDH